MAAPPGRPSSAALERPRSNGSVATPSNACDASPGRWSTAAPSERANIPRLGLSLTEAAEALGVSPDFFAEHVAHELRVVRRGRRKIVAVAELERWLEREAERALEERTA